MEIEQTAPPLETNANDKFPMSGYQCTENGGEKHAHIDTFVVNCVCCVQCWDKVKNLDGSQENMLNILSVFHITRTLSNGTIDGGN